jgi:microcystin-dependent protein
MGSAFIVRRGTPLEPELFIEPGLIVEWFGLSTTVPDGWALCDGTNDTPNLIDKFIIGAGDNYNIGNTGGTFDAVLPTHTHINTVTNSTNSHSHTYAFTTGSAGTSHVGQPGDSSFATLNLSTNTAGDHTHTVTISPASIGENPTDKNLPPYFSLFYIIKEVE